MAVGSLVMAAAFKELGSGMSICRANPALLQQVLKFGVCGAMGQASIFYTIANFDSVVTTADSLPVIENTIVSSCSRPRNHCDQVPFLASSNSKHISKCLHMKGKIL